MAPKKSRSASKHSSTSEASPSKSQRKRKLADLIGPQWSKEELERFYRAYRKHGKDWGKVAAAVHNRSVEMIEALYTMNRAYLSLPKGYASAAGLIAMMTDFYTNMVNSDTERDKDTELFQKPQKRPRTKGVDETLALDNSKPHSVASNNCYLSLLKKRRTGSRPWSVGKRTPRVPISHSSDKDSPLRRGLKLKVDTVDDDVTHEIAKALAEASKRVGSPQVSKTPNRKIDTLSPEQNGDQQHAESEIISTKVHGSEMDEGRCELSLGSTEADIGGYTRSKSGLKGKKSNRKKPKADENVDNLVDDIKEACSGTEEGQRSDVLKGKTKLGNREIKVAKSSSNNGLRKKSKKVIFEEDEDAALDALQTLADLSLRLPETTVDTESSLHFEKEKKIVLKSKLKGNSSTPGAKVTSFRAATHERADPHDVNVLETEDRPTQTKAALRERQKPALKSQFKILKHEEPADTHLGESDKSKDTEGKTNNCLSKGKCNDTVLPTQGKLKKSPEHASSSTSHGKESNDFAPSSAQILSTDQFELPTKVRSRRKIKMPTLLVEPDMKLPEKLANSQSNCSAASLHDRAPNLKEKIFYCLNRRLVRRWCVFEWFYNAIDYPWFAKREFLEYLDHVGLSHISRLTRVEWDVIRSSLGKPRRFSELFLKEEKEKLNEYRESVRQHYAELRAGARDGLPNDLAQPLSVGQRILALHPRTREICDGSVLTVDHNRYRVQFDQTERGVEFVMDIDCMPLNPLENLPESFTKHSLAGSTFIETVNGLELIGQPIEKIEGCIKCAPSVNIENRSGLARFCPSTYCMKNLQQTMGGWASYSTKSNVGCCEIDHTQDAAYTSQTSVQALTKTKEADIQALFDLTCALDKKEAVFLELKHMNDEILENQKDGENPLKQSDMFKKHYAALLLKLNEVNEQVSSALSLLRKRNTYQGSLTLFPPKSVAAMAEPVEQHSSSDYSTEDTHEFGSQVAEIVESSKSKAQIMVNAAMEAISSFEKEGTKLQSVAEVIDFVNDQLYIDDPPPPAHTSTPTNSFHATQASWYHLKSSTTNVSSVNHTSNHNQSHQNKSEILSELIAKCVATLLMIQKCTERQFPPSDVAQVLDSAVTSLKPYCLQNLPLYAEIQKCMGIIRNQILALVPT